MGNRGISANFAAKFEAEGYLAFYQEHKEELILGVRNGYVNLYLNCDRISKVDEKTRVPLTGLINDNLFKPKGSRKQAGKEVRISLDELKRKYKEIKTHSDGKPDKEAIAQANLYLQNNRNDSSDWFCFDIEYVQSNTNRRFDILAITREKSHSYYRVAVIEVKYGSKAISGESGVRKHIKDFYEFYNNKEMNKEEVCSVIHSLRMLGVEVPMSMHSIHPEEIADRVEFYVITINNQQPVNGGSTPKQLMGGQLFKSVDNKWGAKEFSTALTQEGDFYDLVDHDPNMEVTFLFFDGDVESLNIQDIINDERYDREVFKGKE